MTLLGPLVDLTSKAVTAVKDTKKVAVNMVAKKYEKGCNNKTSIHFY
jgi:hypothetical protein